MFVDYKKTWKNSISRENATRGPGRNKLRTYHTFKQDYLCESYVTRPLPRSHRSALAKFRCGVAPIRIETGRYENVPANLRYCFNCSEEIEDETHVLLLCPLYDVLRKDLLKECEKKYDFTELSPLEKLYIIFTDRDLTFYSAKTCHNILIKRRDILYK